MTSVEFARAWLKKYGFFDKESDYDGMIGEAAMEVAEVIAKQNHSGMSHAILMTVLQQLYVAYSDINSEVWQEWLKSPEGEEFRKRFGQL